MNGKDKQVNTTIDCAMRFRHIADRSQKTALSTATMPNGNRMVLAQ
jgi:hypothetical protein